MSDHLLYSLNYCTSLTSWAAVCIIGTDHRAKEKWCKASSVLLTIIIIQQCVCVCVCYVCVNLRVYMSVPAAINTYASIQDTFYWAGSDALTHVHTNVFTLTYTHNHTYTNMYIGAIHSNAKLSGSTIHKCIHWSWTQLSYSYIHTATHIVQCITMVLLF